MRLIALLVIRSSAKPLPTCEKYDLLQLFLSECVRPNMTQWPNRDGVFGSKGLLPVNHNDPHRFTIQLGDIRSYRNKCKVLTLGISQNAPKDFGQRRRVKTSPVGLFAQRLAEHLILLFPIPGGLGSELQFLRVDGRGKPKAALVFFGRQCKFYPFDDHAVGGPLCSRCAARSEERRVGKECRSRWSSYP